VRLGLAGEELDLLVRAAEPKDIGKMAIPEDLLRQHEPLGDQERPFLRDYVLIGERLLDAAPPVRTVAHIVRATQERWDGNGYPDSLAGAQIPLAARIVAACSAFTAMTSERAHAPALTPSQRPGRATKPSRREFDPTVVEALLVVLVEQAPANQRGLSPVAVAR
jgi:response regulator RpfG family c-di-GMP phosphodiesterase